MFNKDKPVKEEEMPVKVKEGFDEHGLSTITLKESEYGGLMKSPSEIAEIIRITVGPAGINMGNLTKIPMPSGKSMMWEVPSIRGIRSEKAIEGIIIHHTDGRAYWEKDYDSAGGVKAPPDCSSENLIMGKGNPGGSCAECKFNAWGSATAKPGKEARGKACKELKVIFMLPKGKAFLPVYFILPPTSLKPIRNYLFGLASEALRVDQVTTIFGLTKKTNTDGVEHAIVEPSMPEKNGELNAEEKKVVAAYVAAIKPALERRVDFTQAEVEGESEE